MFKKFFFLLFLCVLTLISTKEVFAYNGGLLEGKTLYTGGSIGNESYTGYTSNITDFSQTTYYNFNNRTFVWYKFPRKVSINSFYFKKTNYYFNFRFIFYDSNKNVLFDQYYQGLDGTAVFPYVHNVRYISIQRDQNTSSSTYTRFYTFDAYGIVAPVIHDELGNFNCTADYKSANLTWTIPSSNSDFTGVKIYRNGTLIKTLGNSTSYTDFGLAQDTNYTYKITATYNDGYETAGITKTVKTDKIVHDELTDLNSTADYKSASLSWSIPSSNPHLTGVKVYRNGSLIKTLGKSTSFIDTSVVPETDYTYKITATYIDNYETTGITKSVKTEKEPTPEIIGGTFEKQGNGDYLFTWAEPTVGKVKVLIAGVEYQTVDASLLKILIPKSTIKYDFLGSPDVSLIPISFFGKEGQAEKATPLNQASGVSNPISTKDLIGTSVNLLWIVGPFLLVSLVFLLVPKLRNLVFGSFRKNGVENKNKELKEQQDRRFKADKDIKDRQEKEQRERQEKERLERYVAKVEKNKEKAIAAIPIVKEIRGKRETHIRVGKLPRERKQREPRTHRERNRPIRTPRAGRER